MLIRTLANGHVIIGDLTWEHIGIAVLLCVFGALGKMLPYMKRKSPVMECHAVILSKRVEYSNTPQLQYQGERWNYLITFLDDNGNEIELFTSKSNYEKLKEGSTGKLAYEGDTFIEFLVGD